MESRVQTLGLCRQQHRNIQWLQVPLLSCVLYSTCLRMKLGHKQLPFRPTSVTLHLLGWSKPKPVQVFVVQIVYCYLPIL